MPRPANPDLADRIVRVTAEMLEERGVEGTTIRAVAAAVPCSPTVIYHYYESKDGLLHSAVDKGMAWFGEAIGRADTGGGGVERLCATARAYVEWGIRNPSMYRLMYEQRLPRPAEGEELQRRRRGWLSQRMLLADIFAAEPAAHPPGDLDTATNLTFVALHGLTSTAISGRLFGPQLQGEELLAAARKLVDAQVDQWAEAWGLPVAPPAGEP